jgi:hypothetical protein
MTDLRKAAEMALEALSEYTGVVTSGTDPTKWDEVVDGGGPAREAIETLRQALAMERFSEVSQEIEEALKQEPYPEGDIVGPCICGSWPGGKCLKCKRIEPPKREWVGLTDDEIYDYADKFLYQHGSNYGIQSFGKAIEAKLKEKNT